MKRQAMYALPRRKRRPVLRRPLHLHHPRQVAGRLAFADRPDREAEPVLLVALDERVERNTSSFAGCGAPP